MSAGRRVGVAALVLAGLVGTAAHARADGQLSSRLLVGYGARVGGEVAPDEGLFDLGVRTDLLFGPRRANEFRLGPSLELRSADLETAEAGGGLALLAPIANGFPLVLSAGAAWASRPGDADGVVAYASLEFGFRTYNYLAVYGYTLGFVANARRSLEDDAFYEFSFGVAIDLEFVVGVPFMFVTKWLTEGDPEEPE